jgi:hypothetical protein
MKGLVSHGPGELALEVEEAQGGYFALDTVAPSCTGKKVGDEFRRSRSRSLRTKSRCLENIVGSAFCRTAVRRRQLVSGRVLLEEVGQATRCDESRSWNVDVDPYLA